MTNGNAVKAIVAQKAGGMLGVLGGGLGGAVLGGGLGAGIGALAGHDGGSALAGLGIGALGGGLLGALGGGMYGGYKGWQNWSGYSPKKAHLGNYIMGPVIGASLGFNLGSPVLMAARQAKEADRAKLLALAGLLSTAGGLGGAYLGNRFVMGS